jgi:hypothetical protein
VSLKWILSCRKKKKLREERINKKNRKEVRKFNVEGSETIGTTPGGGGEVG